MREEGVVDFHCKLGMRKVLLTMTQNPRAIEKKIGEFKYIKIFCMAENTIS